MEGYGDPLEQYRPPQPGPRAVEIRRIRQRIAAICSIGAGAIHFGVTAEHFTEWWVFGLFFLLAGAGQVAWAVAVWERFRRDVLIAGVAGNLFFVLIWLVTRFVAVPIGPHSGSTEGVGLADTAAVILELAVVAVGSLCLHAGARRARAEPIPARTGTGVTAGVAAVVFLSSGLAIAVSPHDHSEGAEHTAADGHSHGASAEMSDSRDSKTHSHSQDDKANKDEDKADKQGDDEDKHDHDDGEDDAKEDNPEFMGVASMGDHEQDDGAQDHGDGGHDHGDLNGDRMHLPELPDISAASADETAEARKLLTDTIEATNPYRDTKVAKSAGYDVDAALAKHRKKNPDWTPDKPIANLHVANRSMFGDGKTFDPSAPETLLYRREPDGTLNLVGVMFSDVRKGTEPPTTGAPYARWHYHVQCQIGDQVQPLKHGEECPESATPVNSGYMIHVWFVSHETPEGLAYAYALAPPLDQLLAYLS